ncbi:hypothetical protein [Chlamydia psittaci]|uniref:hypothetical protein n=1 Tax=Chlamydia psittaci TaxID=83554 RepID=UPI0005C74A32|nr:hypothetical protein [Chlamydia psittaci]MDS0919813.1 hypothetical protein [Chlamydia psittaci]MDS0989844.1 hypothetical protein [Chlamydia psittaci]MDS0995819.1 hypothetical protein [Chlamydia psittaci]MDS1001503.1 hypothetical protein [Chlamydia psittaci]
MLISATSAHISQREEPLNLFSKESVARNKLTHVVAHCIIQSIIITMLIAGITAAGCCVHPVFFAFLLTIAPIYLSLRLLAGVKLRELFIAFRVYPTEAQIHNITML